MYMLDFESDSIATESFITSFDGVLSPELKLILLILKSSYS